MRGTAYLRVVFAESFGGVATKGQSSGDVWTLRALSRSVEEPEFVLRACTEQREASGHEGGGEVKGCPISANTV